MSIPLIIFFLFALIFLFSLPRHPYPGSFIVKAIPALSLASLALSQIEGLTGILLALGLLFSAGGDVALDLDRQKYFVAGLSLFLVAHLFYIAAFAQDFAPSDGNWLAALLLLIAVALLASRLWPALGRLRAPVMAYVVVITVMGLVATMRAGASLIVIVGAFLFILSDALIAIDKFLTPIPSGRYAVMVTYYSAQLLITWGMVQDATALATLL